MSTLTELQNLQFNLKFVTKQFAKNSKTSEKEQKKELEKCKQAMTKGNMETAKIFAQNAIRKKNESINFLRLSARMDAVAARLDTAIKMKMVTKSMGATCKGMEKVLQGMNPEQISHLMETFEKQFDNMDVASEYMQNAIGESTASSMPEDEVNTLMAQVADENGIQMRAELTGIQQGSKLPTVAQAQATGEDPELDELTARVAALGKR